MTEGFRDDYQIRGDFRYRHEPVPGELSVTWTLGRHQAAGDLADRIVLSRGGAFLVSGLRGVGKTSCVRFAIQMIRDGRERFKRLGEDVELVDVWINLSRPLEPLQLLHHLLRHLYLRLKELHLLSELDEVLHKELRMAFMRTSFEISSRALASSEQGRGSEVGFKQAQWLGIQFMAKFASTDKESQSDEQTLKYLPYDEKAAEFEFLSFSRRLLTGEKSAQPLQPSWLRWLSWLKRRPRQPRKVRVLFVLDELDKLEHPSLESTASPLDSILQALKGIFTTSGFSYVFIGGREIGEKLLADVSRGDSIYESIFAHDVYLPCLWKEQDEVIRTCLTEELRSSLPKDDALTLYFRYKGRGVPRRIWRELNRHVVWGDRGPSVSIDLRRRRYMEVFAKAEEALQNEEVFRDTRNVVNTGDRDRERLSYYYAIDWILSRGQERFDLTQATKVVASLNLGGASDKTVAEAIAGNVIMLLNRRGFIARTGEDITLVLSGLDDELYQLEPWVTFALQGVMPSLEERAEAMFSDVTTSAHPPEPEYIAEYLVVDKLGEGGYGSVYKVKGRDSLFYAAKLQKLRTLDIPAVAELFKGEARLLSTITHPNIVKFYATGKHRNQAFVVMELVEAPSLREVLGKAKALPADYACAIARELANTFHYVHEHGFIRLDVKPSHVFLLPDGGLKVTDFGIAVRADEGPIADPSGPGTPQYMAPEQWRGRVEVRSDIYSLGIMLFEMLTGEAPAGNRWEGNSARWNSQLNALWLLDVPPELKSIIRRACALRSDNRFRTMKEFATALAPFASPNISARPYLDVDPSRGSTVDPYTDIVISTEALSSQSLAEDSSADVPTSVDSTTERETFETFKSLVAPSLHVKMTHLLFDLARGICLWGELDGRVIRKSLGGRPLILGRSAEIVDLQMAGDFVSRQHVAFFPFPDSIEVQDLATANGTLLNGRRLSRATLSDGDMLLVGAWSIVVHVLSSDQVGSSENDPALQQRAHGDDPPRGADVEE